MVKTAPYAAIRVRYTTAYNLHVFDPTTHTTSLPCHPLRDTEAHEITHVATAEHPTCNHIAFVGGPSLT